jgi:haloacetate dehalogenase
MVVEPMLEGFEQRTIATSGATINLVAGGDGPPLLLLHGYPETHVMWHRVAPELAGKFTVVAPDLRGYGDSSKPPGGDNHENYSKRAMAQDGIDVMRALGYERFAVVGHDRGARVAFRMALDHPDAVTQLAVLDILPTNEVYRTVNRLIATAYFHWFFLIQPYDFPERLIGADPEYFYRTLLGRWGGSGIELFSQDALAEYLRCFSDPATIHASCEDYRAGASVDYDMDESDLGKRRIACPMLALNGRFIARMDPLAVWKRWADDVRSIDLPGGHFLAEELPEETLAALREFLA